MRAAPVWVKRIDASNGSRAPAAAKSGYGVNGEIARPHPEKAGDEGLPRRKDVFVTQDRSADDRRVFVHGNNEKEAKKNQLFFSPSHIPLPSYWSFHNLGDVTAFKKGPNQGRAFRHSF